MQGDSPLGEELSASKKGSAAFSYLVKRTSKLFSSYK